jgi:hypothetical protein
MLPKPDYIRWVPGKRTRVRTEPAPVRLRKATGVLRPYVRAEQIPPLTQLVRQCGSCKGLRYIAQTLADEVDQLCAHIGNMGIPAFIKRQK